MTPLVKEKTDVDGEVATCDDATAGKAYPAQDAKHNMEDHENGEKPVRERLQQTTLAAAIMPDALLKSDEDDDEIQNHKSTVAEAHTSPSDVQHKQSEDDGKVPEQETRVPTTPIAAGQSSDPNGSSAKMIGGMARPNSTQDPEQPTRILQSAKDDLDESQHPKQPSNAGEAIYGQRSPRRKRSRDQLDGIETAREQKIAATEGLRAQRISAEIDRSSITSPHLTTIPKDPFEDTAGPDASCEASAQRPTPRLFTPTGFAALAASSSSPFASLGKATTGETRRSFADTRSPEIPPIQALNSKNGAPSTQTETGVFGASIAGSGFASAFKSSNRLSNFASPDGDARIGRDIESQSKQFGTSDITENAKSDSECEHDRNDHGELEQEDIHRSFQHQEVDNGEDGEQTIFQARGSLYAFDTVWKESGKGVFKLNVTKEKDGVADSLEERMICGRFIMRANQTYRLLLNAPVVKGMKVGDSKGTSPTGKSFAFAIIKDGRATPHMIKLGDAAESQALFDAVIQLQSDLT